MLGTRRGRHQRHNRRPRCFSGPQRSGALPHHSKADEKDKMEVQFAFLALAFFAAFMAARSLTAYFKQK